MPTLKLSKFEPNTIMPNRMMAIMGKRGSGKTVLLKDLVYNLNLKFKFDIVLGIAGTEGAKSVFREFIPTCFIHSVDIKIIESFVTLAKTFKKHGKQRNFLLIMDDFMEKKGLLDHDIFREIANNGRHFNFTLIMALQYCMDMKPHFRSQIDYVFAFRETIRSNRKRLWEYFFGMFDDQSSFDATLQKCTQNFECLIMDNAQNNGELSDVLHYYKANSNIPSFQLGRAIFWRLNYMYSNTSPYAMASSGYRKGGIAEELTNRIKDEKKVTAKSTRQDKLQVEKIE